MAKYKQINLNKVKTITIANRKSKVTLKHFAKVFDPSKSFSRYTKSLPQILAARDLRLFVDDFVQAVKRGKPIVILIGAHVIKVGLSPLIIDLLKRNIITCVAMNSAAAIHDVEAAMWGKTSEDVEENIVNGSFGMSKETGEFINRALINGMRDEDSGYGEVLGKALQRAPNRKISILATCYKFNIPVTVHAAIGTDIIHQQPSMNGAATGEMSFRDFKVLCNVVKGLQGGGVVVNIGSAVILPEVFLKALTVTRNIGYRTTGFATANFDMIQHYRTRMNIVLRPTMKNGKGYSFTGHHELMIPLVFAMIKDRLKTG